MATLFSVSWTYKYFMGSLLSIPLHRLERISFLATPGNKCCHGMATLFSISWAYKYFMGSLLTIPLHRLGQISFSANQATSWQHFFWFLGLVNIFMGSLLSIPLHRLQLITFSATPGNKCCHGNTFFLFFLTYKYFYGFFAFHTPAQTAAD